MLFICALMPAGLDGDSDEALKVSDALWMYFRWIICIRVWGFFGAAEELSPW